MIPLGNNKVMKIILSRKGFDSQYGKLPNLILPDGRLLFFPIPDKASGILYKDIHVDVDGYGNLYELLVDLNVKTIKETYTAHLDPDLYYGSIARHKSWKPLFGQTGISLGHLNKSEVGKGDIFLFFGRFRKTRWNSGKIGFDKAEKDIHIIFGYFSIGDVIDLTKMIDKKYEWINYHPHNFISTTPNCIFVASDRLKIGGTAYAGAKVFDRYSEKLRLSASSSKISLWNLPTWFYPFNEKKSPLTYHLKKERWTLFDSYTELQTVGKGQEFVLDADQYPEWKEWVAELIS